MDRLPMFWPDQLETLNRQQLMELVVQYQSLCLNQQELIDEYKKTFAELRELYGD